MLKPDFSPPSLNRVTRPIAPGVCQVLYLPIEGLVHDPIPDALTRIISVMPTITLNWNNAYPEKSNAELVEQSVETEAGIIFEYQQKIIVPFDDKINNKSINDMMRKRYIVLVYSGNKIIRWLGNKENPVRLQMSFTTGARKASNANATTLLFVWHSPERALLLNPSTPLVDE